MPLKGLSSFIYFNIFINTKCVWTKLIIYKTQLKKVANNLSYFRQKLYFPHPLSIIGENKSFKYHARILD